MFSLRRARRRLSWLATGRVVASSFLILLLLGVGLVAWWQLDTLAEDQAHAVAAHSAAVIAQDVSRAIEQIDLTLQTVIGGRQAPQSTDLAAPERYALLAERTPRDRNIGFIDVISADGGILASTRPGQELKNWADRDYFWAQRNAATSGPHVGRPFATTREDTAAIPISHRIDHDGQFAGVVVAALRLTYVRDLLAGLQPGPGGTVALSNDDGIILMRLPFDANDIGRMVSAPAAVRDFTHSGVMASTVRASGDRAAQEIAFHRVGNLPLVVSVSATIDKSAVRWLLCVGAAGAVAAAVLGWWIWQESHARKDAEQASQEKSRFLTTLSHELRSPLQGVLGYADRLSHDSSLTPAQARDVAGIVHAGKQMRAAVNVVLDYARTEARGPTLRPQRIALRPLVEECMAVVEPAAQARRLQTKVIVDPKVPAHFVTDGIQLRHILANLLSNAVKYTPSGMVECRVGGDSEHLTIEVADTGLGIPHEKRHRLFKEFERFGAERTGIEGTGLGLSIANRLARLMGGHMGHRDNPVGGSVFWLELPAAAEERDTRTDTAPAAPDRRLSVLVIDDSDINREVTGSFLRMAGHHVTEAQDGAEAVQIAAAHHFDVVLMDMRMAGVDGLQATRSIRALNGPHGSVPIVAVTANALDHHAEACRRAGMTDHLAKPFTQSELLTVVARAAARGPTTRPQIVSAMDLNVADQLVATMGESAVERLLDQLAQRLEALLRRIEDPAPTVSHDELAELAHDLIGSGGTLGFRRLAEAAKRYESALVSGGADAGEIRRIALATLSEVRCRRSLEALVTS
jgi:signal transduction histidine kinase/DNA-binding response OmpR family regulator